MAILIELEDGEILTYRTDPSELLRGDGTKVNLDKFAYSYISAPYSGNNQIAFSPKNPVIGKVSPRILKIQLGLGCNYHCSYCSQGGQQEELTSSRDAENFSFDWVTEKPDEIQLWGGEPLLYWKKIKILVPKIRAAFGDDVEVSIITNGTLLTKERIDWLYDNGFTVTVSHDGPGQHLRGKDPLDDFDMRQLWRYLFEKFNERASINVVLTPENYDILKTWMWFEERIGTVNINVEGIVMDHGNARVDDEQLKLIYESVKNYVGSGLALIFERIRFSVMQFFESLATSKPLKGSYQVCGMDRKDFIAVDLRGNVLTCQNTGAKDHTIGHINDLASVKLNTSTSFINRDNCRACPVVHLCYGSCMYLQGKEFESTCISSYWYNRAILEGAIQLLTGKKVSKMSAWGPKSAKRVIPIKVAV